MKTLLNAIAVAMIACAGSAVGQTIVYEPYDPAAPQVTVGGSIRGAESALALTILAPPSLAVTVSASPTLYWHASHDTNLPVELVLVEEGGETPLIERVLAEPVAAGVHAFTIPEDITLQIGEIYQFSVAAIADADIRSNDVFASALLTRSAELPSQRAGLDRARALAAAGAWYDALHELRRNEGEEAKRLWSAMLSQADLVLSP